MDISRLWTRFKVFVPLSRASALSSVQPQERFHAIIRCERARADRNRNSFSLVLFNVGDPEANSTRVQYLAHVLANRIRLTDEVGWFDNRHIGTLLPYTSTGGAQRLADDICQAIAAKTSPPECTVYTYPSKWFSNSKGHLAQLHFADFFPEWKTTTSRGLSVSAEHADEANIVFAAQHPLPVLQRAIDVVGALFGLVVLSPLLLLVTLIIKIVSPGPLFFKQQRVGYMGKTFAMWKFRTMKLDADASAHHEYVSRLIKGANGNGPNEPMTKLDNDPRIIPFGKILRKTCLDELPQLINVLRGEMSLVGPRPPIPYEVEDYLQWHYGRFDAVPGMTGLWQVSGKNRLTFSEMMRLDIRYSRKRSLWFDIMILLKTPLAIVSEIKR